MTHPNDEKDPEASLAALFERTAKTPADEARAKFLRHARDVGGAKPRAFLKGFGVWAPALAAAAAVAYFAVPARHRPAVRDAASASAGAIGETSATASAPSVPAPPPADDTADTDDPAFAVLEGEPADIEPFDLGPLMGGSDLRPHGDARGLDLGNRQMERSAP
jgi:hypothetical protein